VMEGIVYHLVSVGVGDEVWEGLRWIGGLLGETSRCSCSVIL